MTPDRKAETWLGAAGWASGSQTWAGTKPAFVPKPTRPSRKATPAREGARDPALGKARLSPPGATSRKRAKRKAVPMWVATR